VTAVSEPTRAAVTDALRDILGATRLLTLATVSPTGEAHVNIAFFAFDDEFRIVILSPETTEHARHLKHNASAAVTVFDSRQDREPRRGVQLFGTMAVLDDAAANRALACFGERFPEIGAAASPTEVFERFHGRFFGLVPARAKVFDETRLIAGDYVALDLSPADVREGRPGVIH
jgi:uncharacterized protein YhbP (UPF0306 family)